MKKTLTTLGAIGLSSILYGQEELALDEFEKFRDLTQTYTHESYARADKRNIEDSLKVLRRTWISRRTLMRLSQSGAILKSPEAVFCLARHSYLLGEKGEALRFISHLNALPDPQGWKYKGYYIKGTIHYEKNELVEATQAFLMAQGDSKSDEVFIAATLALARLSFDSGNYSRAREYLDFLISQKKWNDPLFIESAWTYLKMGKPDLAASEVFTLFSIYPKSEELTRVGQIIGPIYETEKDLSKGTEILEKIATRFTYEEEANREAIKAYGKQEEKILLEIQPDLFFSPPVAVLPSLTLEMLENDSIIRQYLTEFTEFKDDENDLRLGKVFIENLEAYAQKNETIPTTDSLLLIHWLNDLESRYLKFGPEPISDQVVAIDESLKSVRALIQDADDSLQKLAAVQRHLSLAWMNLIGERSREALEIQAEVRSQLQEQTKVYEKLTEIESNLEFKRLTAAYENARVFSEKLQAARGDKNDEFLNRIAVYRKEIQDYAKTTSVKIRNDLPGIKSQHINSLKELSQARNNLMKVARADLKEAIARVEKKLRVNLDQLRWNIAESRYKLYKSSTDQITKSKKLFAQENEQFIGPLVPFSNKNTSAPVSAEIAPSKLYPQGYTETFKQFQTRAQEYLQDAQALKDAIISEKRVPFDTFFKYHAAKTSAEKDLLREKSILAFKSFTDISIDEDRTPYGLYRLAQLHFDRAEEVTRALQEMNSNAEIKTDYSLVIPPLDRIRREYIKFPHRDSSLYLLGHTLLAQGEATKSAATFEELIREYPKSSLIAESELLVGEYYFSKKDLATAAKHYEAVLKIGFNYFYDKALYKLAWSNYLKGDYESSVAYFLILLDYSEQLKEGDRKNYVQYADEATEYIAFSIYRSQGRTAAQRIFNKLGWKPYSKNVVEKAAEISADRGESAQALDLYRLYIEKFPMSDRLPFVLQKQFALLEDLPNKNVAVAEKERSLKLIAKGSKWWEQTENATSRKKAEELNYQILYSLATYYDTTQQPKKAISYYQAIASDSPHSREGYDAQYRLGELELINKDYKAAVVHFDVTARNETFAHNFSNAIYNIVACREKVVSDLGGLDAAITRHGPEGVEVTDLKNSLENFISRVPEDPRMPQVMIRSALVLSSLGKDEEASKRFFQVAQKYPEPHRSQALIASVDIHMQKKAFESASFRIDSIFKEFSDLEPAIKNQLIAAQEEADFKAAQGTPAKYLAFAQKHPDSQFASKALFNGFVAAREKNELNIAEQCLSLLLDKYGSTEEASNAKFERALVLDAAFDFERAVQDYRDVTKSKNASPQIKSRAATNLLSLMLKLNVPDQALMLTKELKPLTSESAYRSSRLEIARGFYDSQDNTSTRELIRTEKLTAGPATLINVSARALYVLSVDLTNERVADKDAIELIQSYTKLSRADQAKVQNEVSEAIAHWHQGKYIQIKGAVINTQTSKQLLLTFQKRVQLLTGYEKDSSDLLSLCGAQGQASIYYYLGKAFNDFLTELNQVKAPENLPPSDWQDFQKAVASISESLTKKSKDAFSSSYDRLVETRTPLPFAEDVAQIILGDKAKVDKNISQLSGWTHSFLTPPTLSSFEDFSQGGNEAASEALAQGIKSIKSIWIEEDVKKADEFFSKALFLAPNFVPAVYNRAIIALFWSKSDTLKQCLSILDRAASNGSNEKLAPKIKLLKSIEAYFNQDYDLAAFLSKSYLESEKNNVSGWSVYVNSLLRKNQSKEGLDAALSFIKEYGPTTESLRLLGHAYLATGSQALASLAFQRSLELDPLHPATLVSYLQTLPEHRRLLIESRILQAVSESRLPQARTNWAVLSAKVYQFEPALKELEKVYSSTGRYAAEVKKDIDVLRKIVSTK